MSKCLVPAMMLALAIGCLADGPININNFIDGSLRPINFPSAVSSEGHFDGSGVLGSTWRAEFVAADGSLIGSPVGFRSAGRLDFRAPNTADRIVTGTPGVPQDITVLVWDVSIFPDWSAAEAVLNGAGYSGPNTAAGSTTFTYTIPVGTPPPIGADRILNFQSFNLTPIIPMPEPGVTALAMAGAVALVWHGLRRKKRNMQTAV